jgi:hypothetical protein
MYEGVQYGTVCENERVSDCAQDCTVFVRFHQADMRLFSVSKRRYFLVPSSGISGLHNIAMHRMPSFIRHLRRPSMLSRVK